MDYPYYNQQTIDETTNQEWLLDQRAIVDGITTESRQTPLHLSAAGGHLEMTKLLLRRGAQLNAQDRFLSSIIQYTIWLFNIAMENPL